MTDIANRKLLHSRMRFCPYREPFGSYVILVVFIVCCTWSTGDDIQSRHMRTYLQLSSADFSSSLSSRKIFLNVHISLTICLRRKHIIRKHIIHPQEQNELQRGLLELVKLQKLFSRIIEIEDELATKLCTESSMDSGGIQTA